MYNWGVTHKHTHTHTNTHIINNCPNDIVPSILTAFEKMIRHSAVTNLKYLTCPVIAWKLNPFKTVGYRFFNSLFCFISLFH